MNIVVLTGAGMSAESGLSTFRDAGGLWEHYKIEDIATPNAWNNNQALVLDFYNKRRAQLADVQPNAGHLALAEAETHHTVQIITQNVDDLHERAGSSSILHLHGELTKVRSSSHPELVYDIGYSKLNKGDLCEKGTQLRPNVVWFGEEVPLMEEAIEIVNKCDILLIIGTSLNVYPAAGLTQYTANNTPIILIDPNPVKYNHSGIKHLKLTATIGIPKALKMI